MSNKFTPAFPDLDSIFALKGERITHAKTRDVIKVVIDNDVYYIKRYTHSGKGLRKYFGRSRLLAEWENLHYFASLGIPVPDCVAFGEQRKGLAYVRGAMVLREIPDVIPLNTVAQFSEFNDFHWRCHLIRQLARYVRLLHQDRFTHGDLFLRNILVNRQGQIYFIDCPQGKKRIQPILRHWKLKDLACLHKEAKGLFSRTDCLRFMLEYTQHAKLTPRDKQVVCKVMFRSISASNLF